MTPQQGRSYGLDSGQVKIFAREKKKFGLMNMLIIVKRSSTGKCFYNFHWKVAFFRKLL